MLDIKLSVYKGILFIRLSGDLTKETTGYFKSQVNELIKEYEIKNVVFNLKEVIKIDSYGLNCLFENYENKHTNICLIESNEFEVKESINKNNNKLNLVSDEMSALKNINI